MEQSSDHQEILKLGKMEKENHFDVLIIGAGISGIDAAYHIQKNCDWASYAILERRGNLGGTWDFFKYPGIRSDSDMYTFGFSWKIWKSAKPIAPAKDILDYLKEAAEEQGIVEKIQFNTDVKSADWKSNDNCWHIVTSKGVRYSCNMLFGCTGYYSYENPYQPHFSGQENFTGPIVHPQKWNEEHDQQILGKKVAIIGSGATAVTILPSIADQVSHVTMVQRTPSYIASAPTEDPMSKFLTKCFPKNTAVKLNRWYSVWITTIAFYFCIWLPNIAKYFCKNLMYKEVKSVMSKKEFDKHFTPPYTPWQQRYCLAPGGDFFQSIREGKASIVTGGIDHFTKSGIQMKDGIHVEADFIIVATGLSLQQNSPFSTIQVCIDGVDYKPGGNLLYNGVMLSDIPNFLFIIGYTNASWTLKADITSLYFTKLLNHMKKENIVKVVPKENPMDNVQREVNTGGLTSGYFTRAGSTLPKLGNKYPWNRGQNNYIFDFVNLTIKGLCLDSLEVTKAKNS